jgi:carbonic anhydrase/acetyltransferase-like protein (isoleucine patch superfamily)
VTVDRWALVGAGSVVTHDVPDVALVVGSPARQVAWVGRTGERLVAEASGRWRCLATGEEFTEADGALRPVSPAEQHGA